MGKTTKSTYTNQNVAFIPTDVVYEIPRDGSAYTINIPMENYSDQINVEIPNEGVTLSNVILKNKGLSVDVTVAESVGLGSLDLILISPGGYTNENLSGDLANNALSRVTIVEVGQPFNTVGDDSVDIYKNIINNTAKVGSLEDQIYPIVADEIARDAAYPTPTDGLIIFNERTKLLEQYNNTFGLWLSGSMFVAVRNSAAIVKKRIVYISGGASTPEGNFPVIDFPTNTTDRELSIGVTTQIGNTVGSLEYVAVATDGLQWIEYGETITAGTQISPKVSGAGADQGLASNDSTFTGVMGFAVQNSGADPSYPNDVLVKISLTAEYY